MLQRFQSGADPATISSTAVRARSGLAMLAAVAILAGCADAGTKEARVAETGALSKPDRIVVFDFSYTPEQEPGAAEQRALTEEEEAIGRQVANLVSSSMIKKLNEEIDIPAVSAASSTAPPGSTLVVEGEFLSIDEGSGAARFIVGFGMGASKMVTKARAIHVSGGQRTLVSEYDIQADSGFMPGMIAGAPEGATGLAVGAAGAGVEVALGNDTIADAKRTGEQFATELIKVLQDKGWVAKKES